MKILNFGSLNIDLTYRVNHLVMPGETESAEQFQRFCGGKGLNQSIALAKAGANVLHAGKIGQDGNFLLQALCEAGVDTSSVVVSDVPSGHAIIQVDQSGQNSIIIYAGANGCITEDEVDLALNRLVPGDWILLQNEINQISSIIHKAHTRGIKIAFNPAPMNEVVKTYPLNLVDLFVVNETEATALTGFTAGKDVLASLEQTYPNAIHLITLGAQGSICSQHGHRYQTAAKRVPVVDTTAAGDTYIGFFLALFLRGYSIETCMNIATTAAAITVSKQGAASSIPTLKELHFSCNHNPA